MKNAKKWYAKRTKVEKLELPKATFTELFATIESELGPEAKVTLIKQLAQTLSPYTEKLLKNNLEAFLCGKLELKLDTATHIKLYDLEMSKSLIKMSDILVGLSARDLIKNDYPRSPRHVGDIHPERPYVGNMWKGKLAWFHNKDIAAADDAKINDPIAIDAFLGTIKSPSHRQTMKSIIKQVQNDPYRHVIQTWTGQYRPNGDERHELRARNIKKLLSGDKSHILDTSHPDILRITNDKSHTKYGLAEKPRHYPFNV
jgi:hypothetical protein